MERISKNITDAVAILKSGGLVAIPTETVYGLGADARNEEAVARIFKAKGRPSNHPLIVHIGDVKELSLWAKDIPEDAFRLAEAFWPGPLTMILKRKEGILDAITGGLETIALRVPNHSTTLELLRLFGGGIVAPSANLYGRVSPTSAQDVEEELGERVDCIVDGGRCSIGIESTIVDLSSGSAKVARLGKITQDEIDKLLGERQTQSKESLQAYPGNKPSHYAPNAKVILSSLEDLDEVLELWQERSSRVGVLTPTLPKNADERVTWLLLGEELEKQAHELYAQLRKADKLSLEVLIALLPKDIGIGSALRDRLKRAAGLGSV